MESDAVIVLGGGAAGLFCAAQVGRSGRPVRVIEHANRVGKKTLMSGGGRCNFTHLDAGPEQFLSANPHFCKSALARYTPADFVSLVERHGIAYHEKEPGQLFCDESSRQIVRLLESECSAAGVSIETGCQIDGVWFDDPGFTVATTSGRHRASALVVATGGLSIPKMGATGLGYAIARQFGHAVVPTRAALVPLTLDGEWLDIAGQLAGVSLPVTASFEDTHFDGAALFTHRGLSGPAILQISSYWSKGELLSLDLLPDRPVEEALLQAQAQRGAAELRSVLGEWLPKRLAQALCERQFGSQPLRRYLPAELRSVAQALNRCPIRPSDTEGYRTAEVTLGGVDTRELSSTRMESTRVPGLYFVGEVVDVTGWLGGYNFQWAWASAFAAAQAITGRRDG